DHDILISRGGATISVLTTRTFTRRPPTPPRIANRVARGVGAPGELAALQQALGEARVGQLSDCSYPFTDPELLGTYEVTWYGQNARRHRFFIHYERGFPSPLPACSLTVTLMMAAIFNYESELLLQPDTEIDTLGELR